MPDAPEWHVASLIVHALPDRMDAVRRCVAAHPGAEIHAEAPGRLVVVLEAPDAATLAEGMTALGRLDHVMAATLVFHQIDTTPAEEETCPC